MENPRVLKLDHVVDLRLKTRKMLPERLSLILISERSPPNLFYRSIPRLWKMSGLVGYDSSSDEDDVREGRQVGSTATVSKEHSAAPDATAIAYSSTTAFGPMVGPSAPTGDNSNGYATEFDDVDSSGQGSVSEREAIRILTQPTHPMTSMPPSPPGSPDPAANARFQRFLELKKKGVHFNEDLAGKSTFRNPTLLSTLMSRAGIEESEQYDTSLPRESWNPTVFPPYAYKEELLKSQQLLQEREEAKKKELSAKGKRTIDFLPARSASPRSATSTPGSMSKGRR